MMRQMRDNMKVIMIVTSAAFVGLMVFGWGMDITGRSSNGTPGTLGKVNGSPVTYDEFNTVYRNMYDQEQKANAQPITSVVNRQIEDAAWNQIVMQKLVQQELVRRGITVTNAEIRQAAKVAPPPEFLQNQLFQTNGQFDLQKYQQFLASPAIDNTLLLQLEAYYRDVIPRSKLYYQVVSGVYIPNSELWSMYRDAHETATVRYIALDPRTLVPDSAVPVTDAEIQSYYDAHQADFQRPASARVQVVAIPKTPNAQDSVAARDSALALRAQIVKDTASFAKLAGEVSSDQGSRSQGGELGVVRKGQTVPAFEQAVFSLPIGEISQPVLTQFGYHLIQVENRWADSAQVRHILIPIVATGTHLDLLSARADSLEKLGESMTVPEAAARMGLTPRSATVTKEVPAVPGIGRIDEGVDWAFGDAQPKEVSQVFEDPSAFYMVQLDSRTPAGPLPLDQASPTIRAILMLQKKVAREREVAAQMLAQIRAGQSLDQVAAAHGVQVREAGPFTRREFVPGLGQVNAAIGTAFGLETGQVSGVVDANDVLYIMQGVSRQPADRADFDKQKATMRAQMQQTMAEQRWQQFLVALRDKAKIVDNHEKVLHPTRSASDTTANAAF